MDMSTHAAKANKRAERQLRAVCVRGGWDVAASFIRYTVSLSKAKLATLLCTTERVPSSHARTSAHMRPPSKSGTKSLA
eukprot:5791615-Amphidinium_carterae.1